MNKVSLISAFIICIAFSLTVAGTANQQDFNGGFEREGPQEGMPEGWSTAFLFRTRDQVEFSWERLAHSGNYSVSIEILNTHPYDTVAYHWNRTFEPFEVGKTYEISGWVKTRDLKLPPFIGVQLLGEESKLNDWIQLKCDGYEKLIGTTNWTYLETRFKVPVGTDWVRVCAGITSPANINGKAWFDNIVISPVSETE